MLGPPSSRFLRFYARTESSYWYRMEVSDLITVDPDILGGTPVFKGTRVPVKTLFEYLENNLPWKNSLSASRLSPVTWHAVSWSVPKPYCLHRRENPAGRVRPVADATSAQWT